jgi:murein DD-endopeptidase MepM/ murein hydrolase activator NlpD
MIRSVPAAAAAVVALFPLPAPAPIPTGPGSSPVPPAGCASAVWSPPVSGGVSRPFDAPEHAWSPGHRGVDFPARPGTPVRAAGPGVVAVAGEVAGSRVVAVAHAGGIRTTYAFLARVTVVEGQEVARGDVLGLSGGTGPGHGAGVVHFGVRRGGRLADPAVLLRRGPVRVRLVP